MPEVRLERALRVPADPTAAALGEVLKAIAEQQGPWRGFALHVGLGDLRMPDVGYVAIPIHLTTEKASDEKLAFDITFSSANLAAAFPGFKGRTGVVEGAIGECTLYLRGTYELPMQFFGKLLDSALLPRVADRSLQNFIEEIGVACEARVNQREADFARYRFYSRSFR
ncbi:MAG TPA: hypothetical protein VFF63_00185 [Candidatus Babeliales bacterium]|nr:hypothetical protein [Candidatus Babeliales bacterium]